MYISMLVSYPNKVDILSTGCRRGVMCKNAAKRQKTTQKCEERRKNERKMLSKRNLGKKYNYSAAIE